MERAAPKREHLENIGNEKEPNIRLYCQLIHLLKNMQNFKAPNPFHNVRPQEELVKIK